jgi:hypothetical protein
VNTSTVVGSLALVLAGVLATGYALGQESNGSPAIKQTAQEKLDAREAARRAAVADHQKRKQDFARNCVKQDLTAAQLEACRAAYRRL